MIRGELWIIKLPFIEGREQRGTRPCLVLADTKTNMIITIPLTSNLQALRFPNTIEIKKSLQNGLEKDSVALVFHIQSLDKKRFVRKIGVIEKEYLDKIEDLLRRLFRF